MKSDYVKILCDTSFLDNYKYVSKDQYLIFVKIHIQKLLQKINVEQIEQIKNNNFGEVEKSIYEILINSSNIYYDILNNIIEEKKLEKIMYELTKRKILKDSINNITFLDEIDYIGKDKIKKLKLSYYYFLELEIYDYYDIEKIDWKNKKQKEYVISKVNYSSLKQIEIKNKLVENIEENKNNIYIYNKKIGILSTYPIRDIKDKYTNDIMLDIYKIKYILTLDGKIKKCSDNKLLKKNNEIMIKQHKNFFRDMMEKYKNIVEKKENKINKLEKDIEIKNNTITSYAKYINEYNSVSIFKKIKKLFKNEKLKLLE